MLGAKGRKMNRTWPIFPKSSLFSGGDRWGISQHFNVLSEEGAMNSLRDLIEGLELEISGKGCKKS